MTQFHAFTFAAAPEDIAADEALHTRLHALQWLSPHDLRVPEGAINPLVLRTAVQELRRMNSRLTPEDKLECIISACTVLYKVLTLHARRKSGDLAAAGADDFLPALIFVTLQANVPRLMSNVLYIERYRDEQQMMGRAGYCFINLRSCIYYLENLTPESLEMDAGAWDEKCAARKEGFLWAWLDAAGRE